MDFSKFLFIALIADLICFAVGLTTAEQMGNNEGAFASSSEALNTIVNTWTGEENKTTFGIIQPQTTNESSNGIVSSTFQVLVGTFSFAQRFVTTLINVVFIIWDVLTAPIKLAGQIILDITNVGSPTFSLVDNSATTRGLNVMINGLAAVWFFGEAIGLMQFIRGGRF